jgi:hypothetical protein
MRQGQQNRRGRNRGGGGGHNGGGHHHNQHQGGGGNHRKPFNSLNRSYESSGPDIKIRGTAMHIAEKYQSLARDAMSSGDTVAAENYLQHAEHYNRIVMASQPQPQPQSQPQSEDGQYQPQPQQPQPHQQQANGHHRYQQNDGYGRRPDQNGQDDADDDTFGMHRPSFLSRPVNLHQQPQPIIPQQAFPQVDGDDQPVPARVNGQAQPDAPQPGLGEGVEAMDAERAPRRRRRRPMGDGEGRPFATRRSRFDNGEASADDQGTQPPSSANGSKDEQA